MNRQRNRGNMRNRGKENNSPKKPSPPKQNGNNDDSFEEVPAEEHNVIESVANRDAKNVFDLLPQRLNEHLKYLVSIGGNVKCGPCGTPLQNDIDDVLNHVASNEHFQRAQMQRLLYKYECEICQNRVGHEKDWLRHLHSKDHKDKFLKIGETRRANLKEYECLSCLFVIYGDKMSINRHKKTFGTKLDKRQMHQVSLKKEVKEMFLNASATANLAEELKKKSNVAMKNDSLVRECLRELVDLIREEYPECDAFLFGSRMSGLGDSNSDIDIFIDAGGVYLGQIKQVHKEQMEIFQKVKLCLSRNPDRFIQIQPIPSARTPIIQVTYDNRDQINCDLSFTHGLSVENTKFVKFCFELQPLVMPCLLVLKRWANEYYLKEEITSYAFCMMFIFYLQMKELLLSVHALREYTNPTPLKISCWKIIDYNRPVEVMQKYVCKYRGSIFDILKDFFKFYKDFKFETELVCPLLGRTILISKFKNSGIGLPPEMSDYIEKLQVDCDYEFNTTSSMCVQDPFDLSHNLTKKVPVPFRKKFQKLCDITYNYMTKK